MGQGNEALLRIDPCRVGEAFLWRDGTAYGLTALWDAENQSLVILRKDGEPLTLGEGDNLRVMYHHTESCSLDHEPIEDPA